MINAKEARDKSKGIKRPTDEDYLDEIMLCINAQICHINREQYEDEVERFIWVLSTKITKGVKNALEKLGYTLFEPWFSPFTKISW